MRLPIVIVSWARPDALQRDGRFTRTTDALPERRLIYQHGWCFTSDKAFIAGEFCLILFSYWTQSFFVVKLYFLFINFRWINFIETGNYSSDGKSLKRTQKQFLFLSNSKEAVSVFVFKVWLQPKCWLRINLIHRCVVVW